MDLIDALWNYSQDKAIEEMHGLHTKENSRSAARLQRLEAENHELRIRIGVLIRLLIERGVFSAEDFAASVKDIQARLAPAPPTPRPRNQPAAPVRPIVRPKRSGN
jgi:hypothetical protein